MTNVAKNTDAVGEETTVSEKMQELAQQAARDVTYARERALENALTLHKQNGGMTLPERIIEDATKSLNFVKGYYCVKHKPYGAYDYVYFGVQNTGRSAPFCIRYRRRTHRNPLIQHARNRAFRGL